MLRPRLGLLAGIAVLAAGSVVLQIALARTLAAVYGPHIAMIAPTLALFGLGAGGALLHLFPGLVRRGALLKRLGHLSALAGAGALAALLVELHVKAPAELDRAALARVAAVYLSAALPFTFVGLAVAGAIRHVGEITGRVHFAMFAGAALGGPLALGAMRAGGPRAALMGGAAFAIAGLFFYLGARGKDREGHALPRPRGGVMATALLAATVLIAGDLGAPWAKLPALRFGGLEKVEAQEWSILGLLTVDKPANGQSNMRTDGTSGVPIFEGKANIPVQGDEMAYALGHNEGPVLVAGAAGGRESRVALKYGFKEIHTIAVDPIAVRAIMLDRMKRTSGDLFERSEIKVVMSEVRGHARRSGPIFRNIVLALPDDQAAINAGMRAGQDSDLYTVEAFDDLLGALLPEGMLLVSRWDSEADRLISLASSALVRAGVAEPAQGLLACSGAKVTSLLVRKKAFDVRELGVLHAFCRKNKLVETLSPDAPHGDVRDRIAQNPASAASFSEAVDLTAPTGDRPFFFDAIPARLVGRTLGDDKVASTSAQGLRVLSGLLGVGSMLLFLVLAVPFAARPPPPGGRMGPLVFHAAAGAALALLGCALIPRLTVLLGHPIYAYTTVIASLLAAAGVGALRAGRLRTWYAHRAAGRRAELLAVLCAIAAFALGPLVEVAMGLPFGARVAAALALLLPMGLLGGSLFPLGVKLTRWRAPDLISWCTAAAGASAFFAAAAATWIALTLGYTAVLLAAGLAAWIAAAATPASPSRGQ